MHTHSPDGKQGSADSYLFGPRQAWLAFAMTINKSQGQSFKHVGLDLSTEVFSHGQLYVGVSRVTDGRNVRLVVPESARESGKVKNVVYHEIFR